MHEKMASDSVVRLLARVMIATRCDSSAQREGNSIHFLWNDFLKLLDLPLVPAGRGCAMVFRREVTLARCMSA